MATNIGVNVVEVDGVGAPSVTGAATSVAAFNIITQRGVPNSAQRVTSFAQFVERFGSYFRGGEGAYLVRGFFDNGGRTAYINRVVDPNAEVGSLELPDAAADPLKTLRLSGGFRGAEDPGAWAAAVSVRVTRSFSGQTRLAEKEPAFVKSSALNAPVDMSAFTPLELNVDGQKTELKFRAADFNDPKKATFDEIVAAIKRQTPPLTASFSDQHELILTSTGATARRLKQWSSVEVTAVNRHSASPRTSPSGRRIAATAAPTSPIQRVQGRRCDHDHRRGDAYRHRQAAHGQRDTGAVTGRFRLPTRWRLDPHKVTVRTAEFDLESQRRTRSMWSSTSRRFRWRAASTTTRTPCSTIR